jgi:hypothetical protein
VLNVTLIVLAFVAGVAGTWSPCGFSIIETISGPQRRVRTSCVTFTFGALAGGAATFALLALIGAIALPLGRTPAALVVAGAAVAGAVAEALGLPIRPQIRRQLPEHWRRTLPLPVAALLYGVLLGSGFATFVYTLALWSIAAMMFVLGSAKLGVLVGLAFGLGRALPVAVIAPIAHLPSGRGVLDVMAQRPVAWRVIRRVAAVGLLAVAAASTAGSASAATTLGAGRDPSVTGDVVVWTAPTGGVARQEGSTSASSVPALAAVGGSLLAWREIDVVHVVRLSDMSPVLDLNVPGINALAVSDTWLVARTQAANQTTVLSAYPLADPAAVRTIATARAPLQLGRPALEGDVLVYHLAGRRVSSLLVADLAAGTRRVIRQSKAALLTNPSLLGGDVVYDRQTSREQLVQVGPIERRGADRVVYRLAAPSVHDAGHEHGYSSHTRSKRPPTSKWKLWTTALSARNVYVTLLPRTGSASAARLVSIAR